MKDLPLLNIEITVVSLLFAYYSGYLLGRKRKIWKFDDKKVAYTIITICIAIILVTALVSFLAK